MAAVELIHDVLDMQLVDRDGEKMGRVDGVTLELREGEPPRVAEILVGGSVLADRIGGPFPLLLRLLARMTGAKTTITRFPFSVVIEIADVVKLDVDAHETTTMRTEHFLDRIVCMIPGAAGSKGGGGE